MQPVLQTFHDEFVKATGHEPPRTHLDYGRDGKRIRELPASYSTEILVQAVKRFFKSPGYIRRSMRFADYIAALPQLVSADGGRPTAGRRVHLGPDHRDPARYDSWER